MKNFKRQILTIERRIIPAHPSVICANSPEEAKRMLAEFREQNGSLFKPIVLVAPWIKKVRFE